MDDDFVTPAAAYAIIAIVALLAFILGWVAV